MGRNVRGSRSWSVPRGERVRREMALTLSDDTREKLERLSRSSGLSKSAIVDELVTAAPEVWPSRTNRKNRTQDT